MIISRNTKPPGGALEKVNLSFESEQQQQVGCLQTTPKIFRFSKDRNRNHQQPQRLPLAAFESRRAASNGNNCERETKLYQEVKRTGLEVSDWRNIEIKRTEGTEGTEGTEEQINPTFLRDSPERGTSPISGGEMKEKQTSPVKLATPTVSTFAENTNKVPPGRI